MTDTAKVLLDLLDLETLDTNLYRGSGSGGETPTRIYGGQVIAQALAAAYASVSGRLCHSLHAYFIRPGDPSRPVIYEVDPSRDGRSFTTRRVVAMQNGKQILNLAASFHAQEDGWQHQHPMPEVAGPESLEPRHEILLRNAFSTFFWIDRKLDLSVVFLTQLAPSSSYPSRPELKALVHGALTA
ncbi:acyl-CoA thioesterase II [Rhodobacterales bacterium Y4I]|nr:acyl-CoA thioesterase II [Rhodobacterales bacterium Y4I]